MVEARRPHHTIELGDDGIIYIALNGNTNESKAVTFSHDIERFKQNLSDKKFPVLIDLKHANTMSPKAITIYAGLLEWPQLTRIAFVHANKVARFFAEMIMSFTHKKNAAFFSHSASAKRYLNGGGIRSPKPKAKPKTPKKRA
jgi:hypothetical protein